MNCSELIVDYLKQAGCERLFGYPGDPSVEVLEAARKHGLEFVLARREGTAGLMAEAYGQLTGKPGVCLSTLGPGSSNLVNPVANAFLDRVPMIALSGQIETRREAYFTHQVIDHQRLFAPISKWVATVRPQSIGTILRKAYRTAMAERPGPVHLTTPNDVVGAEAIDAEIVVPPTHPISTIEIFSAGGVAVDPLRRLRDAARPMIVAGISAVRAGASDAIERLAQRLSCPVVVAPMAKGVLSEDHPMYAGTLDMACNDFIWDFLKKSDLLLMVGFDAVELIKPWTLRVPAIHIDSTPNTDQIYPAELEIVGPIGDVLNALSAGLETVSRQAAFDLKKHRDELKQRYYKGRAQGKLNPTDVLDVVRSAMPRDTIVTTDVGSHKLLVGQGWTTFSSRSLLMTNGLSSMGYALPAAISAKLVHPSRPVVCFIGDGGLAMVQGELRLASSLKLPIVIIVFCDNSLNRIELKQTVRQYPSFGTLIDPTNISLLAKSMECEGVDVDSQKALTELLSGALPHDRPLVVGARIDPSQYAAQF
jgi:acetolactate synthase-1/2/3 large subunit